MATEKQWCLNQAIEILKAYGLCQKIINAQIDPIAIQTDTVNEIKNRI